MRGYRLTTDWQAVLTYMMCENEVLVGTDRRYPTSYATSLRPADSNRPQRYRGKDSLLSAVFLAGSLLTLCFALWLPAALADTDHDRDRGIYIGVGTGIGYLNPDDSDTNIQVEEREDIAGQIYLGMDINRFLGAELQYSRLGTAELSGNGTLDYSEASISGLLYGFNSTRNHIKRTGLRGFGRFGIGRLYTDAENVEHVQSNDYHLLLGAGAEYGFSNGLAVRGEYLSYDHDAKYIQFSVLFRFTSHPDETEKLAPASPVTNIVTATSSDSDNDGVPDARDLCPDSIISAEVDGVGCPVFDGTVDGVNFQSNSAQLTRGAELILDRATAELMNFPKTLIIIKAHTDSVGAASYNQDLSERRANSVARYMAARGITPDRLKPEAYGESQPIADNATKVGRFKNRRVEFDTSQIR